MNLTDKLEIADQVMAREVGDELVILDLGSGRYFGLDAVGARMWQLIGSGKNLGEAIDTMFSEYEVDRAQLEIDLMALADSLTAQKLLTLKPQNR